MLFIAKSGDSMIWPGYIAFFTLLHTAVAMLPPYPIMRYGAENLDLGMSAILQVLTWAGTNITAPFALSIELVAQYWEMGAQLGNPGALSLSSLGLQTVAFAMLSCRWFQRIGRPIDCDPRLKFYSPGFYLQYQYEWSFCAANYAMQAFVCTLLWNGYRA